MKKNLLAAAIMALPCIAHAETYARVVCTGSETSSVHHLKIASEQALTLSEAGILARGQPIRQVRELRQVSGCRDYYLRGTIVGDIFSGDRLESVPVNRGWNVVKISIEGTELLNCGTGSSAKVFDNEDLWLEDLYQKLAAPLQTPVMNEQVSGVNTVSSRSCIIR